MSAPCILCGVRADVGCKHRPADGAAPPAIGDPSLRPLRGGYRYGAASNVQRGGVGRIRGFWEVR